MEGEYSEEKWNMANAYLIRIDRLLTLCDAYQMQGDLKNWYHVLYSLYKELYPKLKTEGKENEKAEAQRLLFKLIGVKNDIEKKNGGKMSIIPFVEFELYLRQKLEDKKLLTPREDIKGL